MKVTVCQTPDRIDEFADRWQALVDHVKGHGTELLLLPEMPFCAWFPSQREFEPSTWQAAVAAHDEWEARLTELAPALVVGTRPVDFGNERYNAGFLWHGPDDVRSVHTKTDLPDEEGDWEASWYQPEEPDFVPVQIGPIVLGFLIGTELWASERAREYGAENVSVLVTPRCTSAASFEQWIAAGREAAILAGAYGLSSNRHDGAGTFGGQGWIVDPRGEVLALTSGEQPLATVDVDLAALGGEAQRLPITTSSGALTK